MKTLFLHIGMSKTGTSAIQDFLKSHSSEINRQKTGIYEEKYQYHTSVNPRNNASFLYYATISEARLSIQEKNVFSELEQNHHDYSKSDWFRRHRNEELERFKDYCTHYDSVILTDERIWDRCFFYEDYWEQLLKQIRKSLGSEWTVKIILYLRRQDIWVLSRYKMDMILKEKIPMDFKESIHHYQHLNALDYSALIQKLESVFQKDNLIVREYNKDCFYRNDLIRDFFHVCGLEWNEDWTSDLKRLSNPSITLKTANAMSLLNKGIINTSANRLDLIRAASKWSRSYPSAKEKIPLSDKEYASFLDTWCNENDYVDRHYFHHPLLIKENALECGTEESPNQQKKLARWLAIMAHLISIKIKLFERNDH